MYVIYPRSQRRACSPSRRRNGVLKGFYRQAYRTNIHFCI
jgi:hypothetical protein